MIDDERRLEGDPIAGELRGDELATPVRKDRNLHSRKLAHLPDQQPAAITTTGASKSARGVRTVRRPFGPATMPVTGCSVWITAPSSRARAAMAVVARYGSAKPSRGEYVAEMRSSVRRYGQPARTSSGSSTRVSTPRLRWSSALLA